MKFFEVKGTIGQTVPRVDARAKVTGTAPYGDDHPVANPTYASLVTSSIALGTVKSFDDTTARTIPGLLKIFTHHDIGHRIRPGKTMLKRGHMATSIAPLRSRKIHFSGQIVAVVVAETKEASRAAAQALKVEYEAVIPSATIGSPGAKLTKPGAMGDTEIKVGNFEKAFLNAEVKIEAEYETPPQHHNPLELFQTTCAWNGDELTVWESTQSVRGSQHGLAAQLGIKPKNVRVISPFIGGAFGSRGELAQSTALIAFAAKKLGRPVKLVISRREGFTNRTFRAETKHRVRLGATREGKLQALNHEGWELTSRADPFALAGIESGTRLYACENIEAKVHNVTADRQTPGFMRAPPEIPYLFALESAIDELAYALGMDPVELRRRNDTMIDPVKGLPFSSRSLLKCYDEAAAAFGWAKRNPKPCATREGDWFIGWGCATAMYPAQIAPATCRVTLYPNEKVLVETGSHEIGTGAYTIIAQTAADQLGVPLANVKVSLGDSRLPAAALSAGSSSAASVCTVVAKACLKIRAKAKAGTVLKKPIAVLAKNNPEGAPRFLGPFLIGRGLAVIVPGHSHKKHVQYAFGAQFVEVRVHRNTGEIRVPRAVGAYAAGRIMNPRTAKSQLMGGQIWGISSALLEGTEIDVKLARYMNADLSEYLMPVNADIGEITTLLVPEEDKLVNPLGIKGLGELGIVGMNAAIANAIFHATGVRRRKLPIRVGDLFSGENLVG